MSQTPGICLSARPVGVEHASQANKGEPQPPARPRNQGKVPRRHRHHGKDPSSDEVCEEEWGPLEVRSVARQNGEIGDVDFYRPTGALGACRILSFLGAESVSHPSHSQHPRAQGTPRVVECVKQGGEVETWASLEGVTCLRFSLSHSFPFRCQ